MLFLLDRFKDNSSRIVIAITQKPQRRFSAKICAVVEVESNEMSIFYVSQCMSFEQQEKLFL
jgi:hypothetical protein